MIKVLNVTTGEVTEREPNEFDLEQQKEIIPTYAELRAEEYPPIQDQLDMQYWDKVNGTTTWSDKIAEVKLKYPKT